MFVLEPNIIDIAT